MHVKPVSRTLALLALASCLAACRLFPVPSTPPTPPDATSCIETPQGVYPAEPTRPAPGAPITDAYVARLLEWGNTTLGIATVDRILWKSERKCLTRMQEAGLIR